MVRKLENGDEEALALWQWFRDESLVEFNRLYNELQVEFDSYNGEAFYNDKMDAVVDILSEKAFLLNQKGPKLSTLRNMELNIQPLSRNRMVQLSISLVTWLQPFTVKTNTNLLNLSTSLVKSNLPTLNNSRLSCKRWAMAGVTTLLTFLLV